MNHDIIREPEMQFGGDVRARWAKLIRDDEAGIDGDIEELIRVCRVKHAYSRDEANAELVRRFSSLGDGRRRIVASREVEQ